MAKMSFWRRAPSDVYLVGGGVLVAALAGTLAPRSPARLALVSPLLVFLPGYALTAVLFPARTPNGWSESGSVAPWSDGPEMAGLSPLERVAASFGLSVAIVPLVGLSLAAVGFGFGFVPLMTTLALVTGALLAGSVRRRRQLAVSKRWDIPVETWLRRVREFVEGPVTVDTAIHAVLVVSVAVAAVSVGVATVAPQDGTSYTEFALLTEDESGEYVAADYPTTLPPSESRELVVSIQNRENEPVRYSIVVVIRRVAEATGSGAERGETLEWERLDRFNVRVPEGETRTQTHEVRSTDSLVGSNLRLTYLLYRGDPPEDPTIDNSYRTLQITVDVPAEGST